MSTDTGSPWSIPYPETSDEPDGPTQFGSMATTTHALLGRAYPCTSSTRPSHTAGLLIYETDTDKLQVSDGAAWDVVWRDSGVLTSGFAAQTGWSNSGCTYQLLGSICVVHLECARTGSTLTTNASSGHLADENVVQFPSAAVSGSDWIWGTGTYSGGGASYQFSWRLRADTDMFVLVSSFVLGVNITSSDTLYADFITVPG